MLGCCVATSVVTCPGSSLPGNRSRLEQVCSSTCCSSSGCQATKKNGRERAEEVWSPGLQGAEGRLQPSSGKASSRLTISYLVIHRAPCSGTLHGLQKLLTSLSYQIRVEGLLWSIQRPLRLLL